MLLLLIDVSSRVRISHRLKLFLVSLFGDAKSSRRSIFIGFQFHLSTFPAEWFSAHDFGVQCQVRRDVFSYVMKYFLLSVCRREYFSRTDLIDDV